MVNKLWLALEWYIYIHIYNGSHAMVSTPRVSCNLHVLDVMLKQFLVIYGKVRIKQVSKQEDRFYC